jgi:Ran GTPase-activating protein (RanGAP) involved in mRNA processing and transport
LDLRNNDIENSGLITITEYLRNDNKIKKLMLSQNKFGDKEAKQMSRALLTVRNLVYLELGDNDLTKKGWKEVL